MKASEYFDLPLEANQESVYQSGGTDEWSAEFNTPEQAQIAAKCINHADKLADALASMLVEHSKHRFPSKVSMQAALILESYRSAK